jgi:probable F420-dependent oxidoreductase
VAHPRPFRFGVQASGAASRTEWVRLARSAESLGYACLTMPDHFNDQLAPMPALMAAADATTTLRVGALVFDNDYKHPLVLAKELATMDVLSDGRVEIGLGAGWMRTDYDAAGMQYDPPGVRVDRFAEGLAVIRGLMADGPFSFEGAHYRITAHDGTPKPVQRPCPPILIGGGGRRVLGIAAREADIVGVNPSLHHGAITPETILGMSAASVDDKIRIVQAAAGARMSHLELNIRTFLVNIRPDADAALAGTSKMLGVDPALVADSPFGLIGPPEKLVEDLLARRERWGFSYVIVGGDDVESFAPVVARLAGT